MQTLHIISHTHWDREWYRSFQQFRLKLVHLVDNVLEILDSDPEYKYFMLDGQTIVLEDYLQMRPENEERLKAYIRNGRILIGPWYILPDEFLVSAEATVRNLLIGKKICADFGSRMMIGYLPDPFGHISQMPQILNGFGIDKACLWRGVPEKMPTLLEWKAPDGSKVLLAHLYYGYGDIADWPSSDMAASKSVLDGRVDRLEDYNQTEHFLLMRGTDHYEPRPLTPKAIAYYNEKSTGRKAVHSTLPNYFSAVQEIMQNQKLEIPVIRGELRDPKKAHMLPGVDSARMWIKQRNWFSQTLLERWVEPFGTWAEIAQRGAEAFSPLKDHVASTRIWNPAPLVHQAWKLLITNHPHDSICGCSVDETHGDMGSRFDQVDQIGEELTSQALQTIVSLADTQPSVPNKKAFAAAIAFNAAPVTVTEDLSITVDLPIGAQSIQVLDENGQEQTASVFIEPPAVKESNTIQISELQNLLTSASSEGRNAEQMVNARLSEEDGLPCIEADFSSLVSPNQEGLMQAFAQVMGLISSSEPSRRLRVRSMSLPKAHIHFLASELPPAGYRTFWLAPSVAAPSPVVEQLEGESIENEWFKISLEPAWDGSISVLDKRNGHTYHGLNHFIDRGDRGDEYNYCPPEHDKAYSPEIYNTEFVRTALDETLYLECKFELPMQLTESRDSREEMTEDCPLTMVIRLPKAAPVIDFQVRFDNRVLDHRLEVCFPSGLQVNTAHYDSHFDIPERPIDLPEHDENWWEQPRPELPQQAFADLSENCRGLMLANQGLPEVAALRDANGKAVLGLTLLRCVGWLSRDDMWVRHGHAGPALETPDAQEQGIYEFAYRLILHDGNWQQASHLAYAFQTALRAEIGSLHQGSLPASASMIKSSKSHFHLTAIKTAEDSSGVVVRGFNPCDTTIELQLQPAFNAGQATLIGLDESHIKTLEMDEYGAISLEIAPHKLASVLFTKPAK
ncbi:MAG: glycoside hydrolase family 38 C-terminal domain-containing protein [Anaerolineaceae bacterium]|nr:glycoside hydrolase family 38 C-terminal domain-containing protein [Anaerolineaceae bacterium]